MYKYIHFETCDGANDNFLSFLTKEVKYHYPK